MCISARRMLVFGEICRQTYSKVNFAISDEFETVQSVRNWKMYAFRTLTAIFVTKIVLVSSYN